MCVMCELCAAGDRCEGSDGEIGGHRERIGGRRCMAQLIHRTWLEMEGRHLL